MVEKKLSVALSAVLVSAGLFAEILYWTGEGGNWSDSANWSTDSAGKNPVAEGRYPGSDPDNSDDEARFTAGASGEINVDVDVSIGLLYVFKSSNELTFKGGHTITPTRGTNNNGTRSHIDDRTVSFTNITFGASGKYLRVCKRLNLLDGAVVKGYICPWATTTGEIPEVHFEEGSVYTGLSEIFTANSRLVFNGGDVGSSTFTCYYETSKACFDFLKGDYLDLTLKTQTNSVISVMDGSVRINSSSVIRGKTCFNITGGKLLINKDISLDDDAVVDFTGGTVEFEAGINVLDRRWLGTGGAVLVSRRNTYGAVDVFTPENPVCRLSSTVIVTNGNLSSFKLGGLQDSYNATVYGPGAIYATRLYNHASNAVPADVHVAVDKVVLKTALTYYAYGIFNFYDVTFGAIGDWKPSHRWKAGTAYFNGTTRFETTDAFDPDVARTITVDRNSYTTPGSELEVSGIGKLVWSPPRSILLDKLTVESGAVFQPTKQVHVTDLVLEDGATVLVESNGAGITFENIEAGEGAKIMINVPTSWTGTAIPFVGMSGVSADASVLDGVVEIAGDGAEKWELRAFNGCVYLHNGSVYEVDSDYDRENFWLGGSESGNLMSIVENWHNGNRPDASAGEIVRFGGHCAPAVTNDFPDPAKFRCFRFMTDCGPYAIRGNPVILTGTGILTSDSCVYSGSKFPVVIDTHVSSAGNPLSVSSVGGSYVTLASNVTAEAGLYVCGHVKVAGKADVSGGTYFKTADSGLPTVIEVLEGGELHVSGQQGASEDYGALWDAYASFNVHEGGKVVFGSDKDPSTGAELSRFGWTTNSVYTHNVVDGTFDVKCPVTGTHPMFFSGTGTLNVESTMSGEADSSIVLAGGIRFTSGGFRTVTSENPDHVINLVVTNDAVLAASRGWTYGPENGIETSTTPADRALSIAHWATLTVEAGPHRVTFEDPISGGGVLAFEEGAKIAIGGALREAAALDWTAVAEVGEITGVPAVYGCNVRVEETEDGTSVLLAKNIIGMRVIFR